MTTPPPDTKVLSETLEQIAERIVREIHAIRPSVNLSELHPMYEADYNTILSALRNERERAFDQGYVCAVANLMRLHDEETVARDVLNQNRPDNWAIIDEADMQALQPIFDHEKAIAAIREGR